MAREYAALGCFCLGGLGLLACSQPPDSASFSPTFASAAASQSDAGKPLGAGGAGSAGTSSKGGGVDPARAGAAADDSGSDAGFCTGQAVTVADLASGSVRGGKQVLLPTLVASSQKFLLSASKTSGNCLWAAFAVDEGKSGENSGVLLLSASDGVKSDSGAGTRVDCTSAGDSLPDDLAPGDRIAAFGAFSDYAPAACHGIAPMRELLVKPGCTITPSSRGEPPSSVTLTSTLADQLAQGQDAALLRAWSGARVELENLSALPADGSASAPTATVATSVVGAYGVIRFRETKLELHSKIPYADLSGGGPHQVEKSLDFAYPTHFARVAGVVFLDYCTWSLEVRDRCADLSPQSRGCAGSGG